jgi:hypothetical protein
MESWTASATENTGALWFVIAPENLKHNRPTLRDQNLRFFGREIGNYMYKFNRHTSPPKLKDY